MENSGENIIDISTLYKLYKLNIFTLQVMCDKYRLPFMEHFHAEPMAQHYEVSWQVCCLKVELTC